MNTRSIADGVQPFVIHAQDAAGQLEQPAVTCRSTIRLQARRSASASSEALSGDRRTRSRWSGVTRRRPGRPRSRARGQRFAQHRRTSRTGLRASPDHCVDPMAAITGIEVPRSGTWVARIWLQDAAGNEDRQTAQSVPLNFDDTPPNVDIAPMDICRPDAHRRPCVGFNVAAGRVPRSKSAGAGTTAWIGLPTTTTPTGFAARLDDEALPDGTYELRARATDSAGNERSTYHEPSGRLAVREVPTRIDTRLVAGQIKMLKARRTRGGRRRTRRVIVVRPKVHFGRTIPIRGRLTMAGGNAVANAAIEVWEQPRIRGAVSQRVAVIGTDGWTLHLQGVAWTKPRAAL